MPWIAAIIAAFWLILSGHYSVFFIFLGVVSVVLVVWVAHRMDIVDHEGQPIHLTPGMPRYFLWLSGQVMRSSLHVARFVYRRRPDVAPACATVEADDLSELEQVVYANSITLTPGTLSISVDDEGIEVHSLEKSGIEDLRAGEMHGRVQRLEKN